MKRNSKEIKREKRKFSRIKDSIFISCFKDRHKNRIEAMARNLSGGGLMFRTDASLKPREVLEIEIYEPVSAHKKLITSINTMAKIVWVQPVDDAIANERFKVGVKFSRMKVEDKDRIAEYIAKQKQREGINFN